MRPRFAHLLCSLLLTACTGPVSALRLLPAGSPSIALCEAACDSTVSLTYLGVSGFLIRAQGAAVLTAPSITHPRLFRVVLGLHIEPDTAAIDQAFARIDSSNIGALLVGHSHYDHLLDVPYLARHLLPHVTIVGTPTTKHVLAGDPALRGSRVVALSPDSVATAYRVGSWYYVADGNGAPKFRIMPVASTHAPNFAGMTIAWWGATRDRQSLPGNAWQWPLGEVYAYVIDVVRRDSSPAFRIFYQDAASDPAHSLLPPFLGRDVRRVDVAIVCAGNFAQAYQYPDVLLGAMHPRFALLSHWEDFFRSQDEELAAVRFTDTHRLGRSLERAMQSSWGSLRPFDVASFRYAYGH